MEQIQVNIDFKDTLNYIFKMNEKEVFYNELQNLIDEIDNNHLQKSKVAILINFLQYKLNVMDYHQDIAKALLKKNKTFDENAFIRNIFQPFCKKDVFSHIKEYMINILIDKLLEMDEMTLDVFKSYITGLNTNHNNNVRLNEVTLIKFFEKKIQEKKKHNSKNSANINASDYSNFNNNNFGNNINNLNNINNINNVNNANNHNIPNQKMHKKNANQNCSLEEEYEKEIITKKEFRYRLKIFYLDGADTYSQVCNILSYSQMDYTSFIYNLKKKLGIYEHAKFKIVILDKNKEEKEFLDTISQLKLNDVNELKIVPFNYVLGKIYD